MNFELARMWKKAIVICFKVSYHPLSGYREENTGSSEGVLSKVAKTQN
jgi:hypothetical protein